MDVLDGASGKEAGEAAEAVLDSYSTSSAFESSAHLLHGIIHMNGFGHLMRINGLEGGSSFLTGLPLRHYCMREDAKECPTCEIW